MQAACTSPRPASPGGACVRDAKVQLSKMAAADLFGPLWHYDPLGFVSYIYIYIYLCWFMLIYIHIYIYNYPYSKIMSEMNLGNDELSALISSINTNLWKRRTWNNESCLPSLLGHPTAPAKLQAEADECTKKDRWRLRHGWRSEAEKS